MAYHDNDDRTLFIGNLHKNVTEDLLYELFLQAGPIERVSIPKSSNQNSQYGFVTYVHECAVDYALQLYRGTCLFGRRLLIKRKGDRRPEPLCYQERRSSEVLHNPEKSINNPAVLEKLYLPKFSHQQSDHSGSSKTNLYSQNLMQMSYKGHNSQRYRPYDRDSRRQSSTRPENFSNRDRHRSHSSSHHGKSHRERKGRYYN